MQGILVIVLFVAALAYIGYKVSRSFTAKGCDKGCGGACQNVKMPQNVN